MNVDSSSWKNWMIIVGVRIKIGLSIANLSAVYKGVEISSTMCDL